MFAQPGGDHVTVAQYSGLSPTDDIDDRSGGLLGMCQRGRAVKHQNGVDLNVADQYGQSIGISGPRCIADDVDWIAAAPCGGQTLVQFGDRILRQFSQLAARLYQSIRGEHARPAPIRQDGEPLANLLMGQCQSLGGIEQFGHRPDPQHSGATKHRVIYRVCAGQDASMRGGGARTGVRAARL